VCDFQDSNCYELHPPTQNKSIKYEQEIGNLFICGYNWNIASI
jgi:hypothetical protein